MTSIAHRLSFNLVKAEDESVDDEYQVYLDGEETAFAIQCTFGFYSVNESGYERPGDESSFYVIFHDSEVGSLPRAKDTVAHLIGLRLPPSSSATLPKDAARSR